MNEQAADGIVRDEMDYDVLVVGGGPAGLSAAIRIRQLAAEQGRDVSVCVLEKGSEIGAHILSGAVMDPRALTELIPDWKERGAPLDVPVTRDQFLFLTPDKAHAVPEKLLPACFQNHGNYVISLSDVTKWLGQQAEALGVEIFAGFPAAQVAYGDDGSVRGVITGDMGVEKDGSRGPNFQLGMQLNARYTLFCEGTRGHLGRELMERFDLRKHSDAQSYGIGVKEIWEVPEAQREPGLVVHTAGWPLDAKTYGGGFLYHGADGRVAIGYVVGLSYANPYLSPFEEFQRLKTHLAIRKMLERGKRISYGARAITAGGINSLPELVFPGGALAGCEAGFLNASRIKGSHAAIKTGMMAGESAFHAVAADRSHDVLADYPDAFRQSWLHDELNQARNFKQWMGKGLYVGAFMVGLEQKVLGGKFPWTLHNRKADHEHLRPASEFQPIDYPKPDGKLTFDRLSSVFVSNTNHEENQPAHLTLKDASVPIAVNRARYAGPESRYCPAGVYEFVADDSGTESLRINAQNCVHCKTCDIKDPTQNIVWVTPEGGGGPNYSGM